MHILLILTKCKFLHVKIPNIISCHYRLHFMITNVRPCTFFCGLPLRLSALTQWKKGTPWYKKCDTAHGSHACTVSFLCPSERTGNETPHSPSPVPLWWPHRQCWSTATVGGPQEAPQTLPKDSGPRSAKIHHPFGSNWQLWVQLPRRSWSQPVQCGISLRLRSYVTQAFPGSDSWSKEL